MNVQKDIHKLHFPYSMNIEYFEIKKIDDHFAEYL